MDATVAVAVVGGIFTVIAALIAARTATNAERTKRKADETQLAINAWKELTAQHKADRDADAVRCATEIAERDAIIAALSKQNEALHAQLSQKGDE